MRCPSSDSISALVGRGCRGGRSDVKRWRDGRMVLRWCAAGMGEAAKQFRRVNGYLYLTSLRAALEAHDALCVYNR